MELLRPRDFAWLLLASDELHPRRRARDQQADVAGLEMKRHILQQLAERDPASDLMESALLEIIQQMEPPDGPPRAVAAMIQEEWRAATPEWIDYLLQQATMRSEGKK